MTPARGDRHGRAAQAICAARLAGAPLGVLAEDARPRDEAEGYAVQARLHELLGAAGRGEVVGHKIGCTTRVMQTVLDIGHPCAGGVLSSATQFGAGEFRRADFVRPGIECEIAVRLGADLAPGGAPFTRDSVAAAVEACLAAIEVVDDRYSDFRELGVPTLVADDFFAAGCVLGPPVTGWRDFDLAALEAATAIDGVEIGRGRGADVMGHPLEALAWLANGMAGRGRGLRRGQFVLTGSIVAVHWLAPGEAAAVEVEGLGAVSARFD